MSAGPRLLAVGGAHVDRRGIMTADFVPGASIPGTMREDVGGGAFNALRNAVSRGARGTLFSVRGGDMAGDMVARSVAEAGVADLSAVFLDRATASYTALLDRQGDVVAALADMALYDIAFPKQVRRAKLREAIAAADGVLADANLPAAALQTLAAEADASAKPLFAIAISPAKVVRLRDTVDRLSCLFLNRREAAALAGASMAEPTDALVRTLIQRGLRRGVVTQGDAPILGFEDGTVFALDPPAPRRIADVTGAGDALAGATIVGLLRGLSLVEALREGAAAALLTIESSRSVSDLPAKAFAEALALVPAAWPVA